MRLIFLLLLLSGLTACRTPRQFEAEQRAQERERALQRQQELDRQRRLAEERERTQLLMEDTDQRMAEVRRELGAVQSDLTAKASNRDLQQLEQRITALEQQINRLEARQAKDREEIIEVLSRRMAELMASRPAATGGRTHTVARGETLSAIAAAYGVRSRAIIQANNLSNPNALRVGQKLVIPGN